MSDLPVSNVLSKYYDKSIDVMSPVLSELVRVVKYDEKGVEHVAYQEFDSKSYQESLGQVDNWSLDSLMKAGIDPRFPVSTSPASRLDLSQNVQRFVDYAETIDVEKSDVESEN